LPPFFFFFLPFGFIPPVWYGIGLNLTLYILE
jgi:hypothetical protein